MTSAIRLFLVSITAACLAGTALSAAADESRPEPEDERALLRCIHKAGIKEPALRACIGVAARKCEARPGGETTVGLTICYRQESTIWDDLLNSHYRDLGDSLTVTGKGILTDVQRAWIEWSKAKCQLPFALFEDGSMARPASAACHLNATATRAIELRIALDSFSE